MKISLIAAVANNRVIGKGGKLPWRLPEDLKYFRRLTEDHIVIMGRKTFESIRKPLPKRVNIVVTSRVGYDPGGVLVVSSLDAALERAKQILESRAPKKDDEVFVIGGAQIYREAIEKADKIYLTEIEADFEGDAFFPEIDMEKWKVSKSVTGGTDPFPYRFTTFVRK